MRSAARSSARSASGPATSAANCSVDSTAGRVLATRGAPARPGRPGRASGTLHAWRRAPTTCTQRSRRAAAAASGQRLTANREALVDTLTEAPRPLTIPEILETRRGLAQSSVYRNLVVLEEAGIVHRVVGTDEFARWELAEDLTGHHHHLICASCGRVEDVPASAGLERSVAAAAAAITQTTGFRTQRHRVDLVGVCSDWVSRLVIRP